MRACFQFQDMDMLQHGQSVRAWYEDLRDLVIHGGPPESRFRLPGWFFHPLVAEAIGSVEDNVMRLYQVYHDCGKHLCRTVDADGRQHFPDHELYSRQRWLDLGGSDEVAELIGRDMEAHRLGAGDCVAFASRPYAIPLLLTALAELHSNAQMFGGISSTSFKIKWKNLDRMGGKVVSAVVAQRQSRDL